MSTLITSACWRLQMPPTQKAVLISLADNANDQGYCWPSIPTICERTCFSERAVHRAIAWLEEAGLVRADRSSGRHTKYVLDPSNYTAPPQMRRSRISGAPVIAASQLPQIGQQPPQIRQLPPSELRSNHKEPTRTSRSNHQDVVVSSDLLPDLSAGLVKDFMAVRKAKRSPLTATAVVGLRREAAKAGMTLESVITLCCERGWVGFKAEWVTGEREASSSRIGMRRSTGQPEILPELIA